jgi:capsular exopolysaccharide synthesis family protein
MAIESLRAIHSVMKINPSAASAKVLLTTSTRPGEGKTFVTTNIALTFAQHGERVLVVDADLRLPNVAPSMGIETDNGISKYFNNEITLDEAILKDFEPNLDILPVGSVCKNPTQVINSPRFDELIRELRTRYDRIFIDSPPLGAVSDALHLVPKVDGVIYVVRFNLVKKRNAMSCIARLREAGVPIVGAVLNSMATRLAAFYTNSYDASYSKYYTDAADQGSEKPAPKKDPVV